MNTEGTLLNGSDPTTLLIVVVGVGLVYLFARWASGHRNGEPGAAPQSHLEQLPELKFVAAQPRADVGYVEPPSAGEGFVVRKFYFSKFDTVPGPPDPLAFCDDLTVEVYVQETGATWTDVYTVASPKGIRAHMDAQRWDVFFTEQVFVVREYDLGLIRGAILDHIRDIVLQAKEEEKSLRPPETPAVG